MKREEQILMLLHPERYTDEQLSQMLDEADITVPDASEEWKRFEENLSQEGETPSVETSPRRRKPQERLMFRIAAMFIGVLALSGITYATYRMATDTDDEQKVEVQKAQVAEAQQQTVAEAVNDSTMMKPVVFEDAELASILKDIAAFHQMEVVYRKDASKHVRLYFTWDKKTGIDDIINTFNKFERIHITRKDSKLIVE